MRRSAAPPVANVSVFNETPWPITVHRGGSGHDAGVVIAPGDDAILAIPAVSGASLAVTAHDRRRTYALDLALLGFDTVHVRTADLSSCARPL